MTFPRSTVRERSYCVSGDTWIHSDLVGCVISQKHTSPSEGSRSILHMLSVFQVSLFASKVHRQLSESSLVSVTETASVSVLFVLFRFASHHRKLRISTVMLLQLTQQVGGCRLSSWFPCLSLEQIISIPHGNKYVFSSCKCKMLNKFKKQVININNNKKGNNIVKEVQIEFIKVF